MGSLVLTLLLSRPLRKCCFDANKKKTKLGRRGWKMYYLTLRDLVLYCFKVLISWPERKGAREFMVSIFCVRYGA